MFMLGIYVNSISTNYTMITKVVISPSVAIFFTIFSDLNPGLKYPLWIVIVTVIASIISVILWLKGESKIEYKTLN